MSSRSAALVRYCVATAAVGFAGVAVAQSEPLPPPDAWFLSVGAWAGVVALVTQFVKTRFDWHGTSVVIFSFAFSIAGALLASTGLLEFIRIVLDATPLEAVVFGIGAAAVASGGYDVTMTLLEKGRPITVNTPTITTEAVPAAQSVVMPSTGGVITDFIVMLAQQAVGAIKLPAALVALAPLLTEFAQSDAILTDDLRSDLQGRVLKLLRSAGLVGVDL